MSVSRATIAGTAIIEGKGLFTGAHCRCTFAPAAAGEGIAFERRDLPGSPCIRAHIGALHAHPVHPAFARLPPRCTALARGIDGTNGSESRATVYTTEHALAAVAGMGITDIRIEVEGPELPIADGSARPFAEALTRVGVTPLDGEIQAVVVTEPLLVESPDGSASISAEPVPPGGRAQWRYLLDYGAGSPIPAQEAAWDGRPESFLTQVAPARTFSLRAEVEQMLGLGLFTGFTPRDLVVVGDDGEPIDNHWRLDAEPARHKLLDLIGDLALAARPIHANITASRSGHALNHAMARLLAGPAD